MTDLDGRLLAALRETPPTLRGLVAAAARAGVGETDAGPEGEWSLAGLVEHFVNAEEAWLERRVDLMLGQEAPFMPLYPDPDYAQAREVEHPLADFTRRRAASVARLEALPDDAWERTGRHERYGEMTLRTAVAHIVAHDAQHLAQIARRLG